MLVDHIALLGVIKRFKVYINGFEVHLSCVRFDDAVSTWYLNSRYWSWPLLSAYNSSVCRITGAGAATAVQQICRCKLRCQVPYEYNMSGQIIL